MLKSSIVVAAGLTIAVVHFVHALRDPCVEDVILAVAYFILTLENV
jgi:hypothetical protein